VVVEKPDPFAWLAPECTGDESSYENCARKIRKTLVSFFASNRCEDAENLASECLFRLTEKLGAGGLSDFNSEAARRGYLRGIARHVLHEWQRRPEGADVPLDDEDRPEYSVRPIDLIRDECLKLYREAVRRNAAQLSLIEKDITALLDPDYGSLAELAKARGTTRAAMRKRAERMRERFRKLLAGFERFDDLLRCLGIDWD
jgi:DNA-directed RNA polymerase specialized sigma24 family protein